MPQTDELRYSCCRARALLERGPSAAARHHGAVSAWAL